MLLINLRFAVIRFDGFDRHFGSVYVCILFVCCVFVCFGRYLCGLLIRSRNKDLLNAN